MHVLSRFVHVDAVVEAFVRLRDPFVEGNRGRKDAILARSLKGLVDQALPGHKAFSSSMPRVPSPTKSLWNSCNPLESRPRQSA